MSVHDLIVRHRATLAAAGIDRPEADLHRLAEYATGATRRELRARGADEVPADAVMRFDALVARRARREPLQHIIGQTQFRTIDLACAASVFVPRPETEVLAGLAIDAARQRAESGRVRVVDLCTGSGAVALSIAAEVDGVDVVGVDIDPVAVDLARRNLLRVASGAAGPPGIAPRSSCAVLVGDLFAPLDVAWHGRVDVLVANPPYLTPAEVDGAEPEVRDHDPQIALVGGEDGNQVSLAIVRSALTWLSPTGVMLLEVSELRADDIAAAVDEVGLAASIALDLTGRPRVVVGTAHRA